MKSRLFSVLALAALAAGTLYAGEEDRPYLGSGGLINLKHQQEVVVEEDVYFKTLEGRDISKESFDMSEYTIPASLTTLSLVPTISQGDDEMASFFGLQLNQGTIQRVLGATASIFTGRSKTRSILTQTNRSISAVSEAGRQLGSLGKLLGKGPTKALGSVGISGPRVGGSRSSAGLGSGGPINQN